MSDLGRCLLSSLIDDTMGQLSAPNQLSSHLNFLLLLLTPNCFVNDFVSKVKFLSISFAGYSNAMDEKKEKKYRKMGEWNLDR